MRKSLLLCLLLLAVAVAQPGWKLFQAPDSSFSCQFPPDSTGGPEPADPGDFSVAYGVKDASNRLVESYSAAWIMGDPKEFDLEKLLLGAASEDSRLVEGPRKFKQEGVDAIEATWVVPDENGDIRLTMRLLRGTDRMFLGTVTGLSSIARLPERCETFMSSIKLKG